MTEKEEMLVIDGMQFTREEAEILYRRLSVVFN